MTGHLIQVKGHNIVYASIVIFLFNYRFFFIHVFFQSSGKISSFNNVFHLFRLAVKNSTFNFLSKLLT